MLAIRKRGRNYYADLRTSTPRLRGSLGTRSNDSAVRLRQKLETALVEGPDSLLWPELKKQLPEDTYFRFANYAGVRERHLPSWIDLKRGFTIFMEQRI